MIKNPEEIKVKIDEYIDKAPPFLKLICLKLRELILAADPEITETWKWQAPVYEKNGLVCAFGSFKKHVRLSFFQGAFLKDPHHLLLEGEGNATMRSINFTHISQVNEEVLKAYVQEAVLLKPVKSKAPAKPLVIPEDFQVALDTVPKIKAVFDKLSHTHRKEYVTWINTAVKTETRQRRIAKTLEKLLESKK